jgi:hypothetical protein
MRRYPFRLPTPPLPPPSPGAFFIFPATLLPGLSPQHWAWQQALYLRAFAEAQAIVRPSLPERDLLAVWN